MGRLPPSTASGFFGRKSLTSPSKQENYGQKLTIREKKAARGPRMLVCEISDPTRPQRLPQTWSPAKKFQAWEKSQALQSQGRSICRSHRRRFTWFKLVGWFFFWWFGFFWTLLNSNFLNRCSRPEAGAEHSVNGGEAELSPCSSILSKFVFQMIKPSEEFQHPQSLWLKCSSPKSSHGGTSQHTHLLPPGTGGERLRTHFHALNSMEEPEENPDELAASDKQ